LTRGQEIVIAGFALRQRIFENWHRVGPVIVGWPRLPRTLTPLAFPELGFAAALVSRSWPKYGRQEVAARRADILLVAMGFTESAGNAVVGPSAIASLMLHGGPGLFRGRQTKQRHLARKLSMTAIEVPRPYGENARTLAASVASSTADLTMLP
jgi:hypothetical protein